MQINAIQVILQIVNFAILAIVLTKFLYKPILSILDSRAKRIQEGLEAAEKSLTEKAKLEEKKQAILAESEAKAADVLDQARLEAKAASKQIVAEARTEATKAVEREYQILEGKLREEELKIRHNLSDLIAETTATVLQGALTQKTQQQIIKSQITEINKLKS